MASSRSSPPAALVAAAFASWSSDLPSGLAGSFRFWVLYSAAVTALGGVASIIKYRVGAGVSAGALLIFGPLAAANIHDYIDFGFSIGPGLYGLLAAGLAGLVLAVVTLTIVSPRASGPANLVASAVAGVGGALLALGAYMSLRHFLLDNNVWWDIFDVSFVVLPLAVGILTLAARSRAAAALALGVTAAYAAQWAGEALYSSDALSYPALRGVGIAVLGAGSLIGALAPATESEDIARLPMWISIAGLVVLAGTLVLGAAAFNV